jgi:hypothetical protein
MSPHTPHPRVVMVGAIPMSALVAEAPDPRAVPVAIRGGGTSAAYFDCPGNPRLSLLRKAVSQGFTVIALATERRPFTTTTFWRPNNASSWPSGPSTRSSRRMAAERECSCSCTRLAANWPWG